MLPGRSELDEITALTMAFCECSLGLPREDQVQDEPARQWIRTIRRAMDITEIKIETAWERHHGAYWLKAAALLKSRGGRSKRRKTRSFRDDFCDALDELTYWVSEQLRRAGSLKSSHSAESFVFPSVEKPHEPARKIVPRRIAENIWTI
jgi:hypothetical protein